MLRFLATGPLWLDEALSVSIAGLPLGDIGEALRHDGSPPAYYVLLHFWIRLVGDSPVAARALSALAAAATVPATWAFAREVSGSRRIAWTSALLVATSPFASRYAAEARMYALLQLLCALAGWALVRLVRRPSWRNATAVAACSGLLLLTHYWSMYLVAAAVGVLAVRRAWRAVAAVAAGGLLFVPWLPGFLFQLRHTGTPWAPRPRLGLLVDAIIDWSGTGTAGRLLLVVVVVLALLGAAGAGVDARRVELDLRGRPLGRRLAAVTFGTLLLGALAGLVAGTTYAGRYSAVVLVPFLVLVATGTVALLDDRVRIAVVGTAAVLGLLASVSAVRNPRTQAGEVAAAIDGIGPRDVVVYCPDQLGPAVSRLLPDGVDQVVFPTGAPPYRVDWVDYQRRNESSRPVAFADEVVSAHPDGAVWLVMANGYRTFGNRCEQLAERLRTLRPANETLVRPRGRYLERAALLRFSP